jgi:SAM-dependent methyltransferase
VVPNDSIGGPHESAQGQYIASEASDAFERERLSLLGEMTNPITMRRLHHLGIRQGWRCLEVGAGNGAVARWLAAQVGTASAEGGRVVATDLNTRFLTGQGLPNLEVRQHNILTDELESGRYDLVHCRLVLMHLPDPLPALERMASAVRPGGWLLVEEGDFGSFGPADPSHPRAAGAHHRGQMLLGALQKARVMDCYFGRRLPLLFDRLGFVDVGHEGITLVRHGSSPGARFIKMSNQLGRARLTAAGALSDADFEAQDQAYDDPSFAYVDMTLFGVWGRRPG